MRILVFFWFIGAVLSFIYAIYKEGQLTIRDFALFPIFCLLGPIPLVGMFCEDYGGAILWKKK